MSLKPGQYTQPLVRPAFVQQPMVAGYTTIRLLAGLQVSGTGTCPSLPDNLVMAVVENRGDVSVSVQFRQVGDYSSGLAFRSNLGNVISLVPKGRKTTTFTPQQQYVELWGVSGGPAEVRVQLDTMVPWTIIPFAKGDTTYPSVLWQPPSYNPPSA